MHHFVSGLGGLCLPRSPRNKVRNLDLSQLIQYMPLTEKFMKKNQCQWLQWVSGWEDYQSDSLFYFLMRFEIEFLETKRPGQK